MRAEEIQRHLRKQPFKPLIVHMSDGSSYPVRHPEMALVTRAEVAIARDTGRGSIADEMVYCDPVHITRIEPTNGLARRGGARRRRRR